MTLLLSSPRLPETKILFDLLSRYEPDSIICLKQQRVQVLAREWCLRNKKTLQVVDFIDLKSRADINIAVSFEENKELFSFSRNLQIPYVEVLEKNQAYYFNVK